MKDKIFEEYGYKVDILIYKKNYICFKYNEFQYIVLKTNLSEKELSELNRIVNFLDNYAVFFHQLIQNKEGFSFEFGGEQYVLIKPRIVSDRVITLNEIIKTSNISVEYTTENMIASKVDFLEIYMANYETLEFENANYFFGLAENAVALFNLLGKNGKKYINHRRIHYNEKAIDFYNPFNIVIDYRSRDLAEYAKSKFIAGDNKIVEYLKYLNYNDWYSYFVRVLYPSFYFDLIDDCVNNAKKMDKKRVKILSNSFEKTIRELYSFINLRIRIPYIEWLSDVNNF